MCHRRSPPNLSARPCFQNTQHGLLLRIMQTRKLSDCCSQAVTFVRPCLLRIRRLQRMKPQELRPTLIRMRRLTSRGAASSKKHFDRSLFSEYQPTELSRQIEASNHNRQQRFKKLGAGFARNRNKYADFAEICCADFGEVGLHRVGLKKMRCPKSFQEYSTLNVC